MVPEELEPAHAFNALDEHLRCAIVDWVTQRHADNLEIVQIAVGKAADNRTQVCRDNAISLVYVERGGADGGDVTRTVEFVKWTSVADGLARQLVITISGKVQCICPINQHERRYTGPNIELLLPDVPAVMRRAVREPLPSWVSLYAAHIRAYRCFSGPHTEDKSVWPPIACTVCDGAAAAGAPRDVIERACMSIHICRSCCGGMHVACAGWLVRCMARQRGVAPSELGKKYDAHMFTCPMCHFQSDD